MVPYTVFRVVQQVGDLFGGGEGGENFGEKAGVVTATGFEDELTGCGTLGVSQRTHWFRRWQV